MCILKPVELAKALDIGNANVSMAVKNGTLSCAEDKSIDLSKPMNRAWVDKMLAKGKTFDLNRAYNRPLGKPGRKKRTETTAVPVVKQVKVPKPVFKEIQSKQSAPVNREVQPKPTAHVYDETDVEIPEPKTVQVQRYPQTQLTKGDKSTRDDLFVKKQKLEIKKLENTNKKEALQIAKLEGKLLPVDVVEKIFLWSASDMKKTYEQDVCSLISRLVKNAGGTQDDYISLKKDAMQNISITGETFKENLLTGLENQINEYKEVRGRGERR